MSPVIGDVTEAALSSYCNEKRAGTLLLQLQLATLASLSNVNPE